MEGRSAGHRCRRMGKPRAARRTSRRRSRRSRLAVFRGTVTLALAFGDIRQRLVVQADRLVLGSFEHVLFEILVHRFIALRIGQRRALGSRHLGDVGAQAELRPELNLLIFDRLVDFDVLLEALYQIFLERLDRDRLVGDLAQRYNRILVVVAVDGQRCATRNVAGALGRQQDQLESVGNFNDAVFDRNPRHEPRSPENVLILQYKWAAIALQQRRPAPAGYPANATGSGGSMAPLAPTVRLQISSNARATRRVE